MKPEDQEHIVSFYSDKQDVGVKERDRSALIDLRHFNNWVKSVLIRNHCPEKGVVFDMGCGKGGDLKKWLRSNAFAVLMADPAEGSVRQALKRYNEICFDYDEDLGRLRRRMRAQFVVCDCFRTQLWDHYRPGAPIFSLVSCQFALHYAFDCEKTARTALRNAAEMLKPGGRFVGTIPDAAEICRRAAAKYSSLSYGRPGVYKVDFNGGGAEDVSQLKDIHILPDYGVRYLFTLEEAVGGVPEYLVKKEVLVRLAREFGLVLEEMSPFADFYVNHRNDQEGSFYGDMVGKGLQVDGVASSLPPISEAQSEAISIYSVFVFRKEKSPPKSSKFVQLGSLLSLDPERKLVYADILKVPS